MQCWNAERLQPRSFEGVAFELDRGERVNEAQVGRDLADIVVGKVDALDHWQVGQAWQRQSATQSATSSNQHFIYLLHL